LTPEDKKYPIKKKRKKTIMFIFKKKKDSKLQTYLKKLLEILNSNHFLSSTFIFLLGSI